MTCDDTITVTVIMCAAGGELQRVATLLLHLVPPPRWLLRPQHVRGRGRGELPQVSGESGGGGEGEACREEGEEDG